MIMNGYKWQSDKVAALQVYYKNIHTGQNTTELTVYSTRLNIFMKQ